MDYDILALKRKMLVKYDFFGSVVANVDYQESRNIPTAATDGEKIYYNPEFLQSLSVDEQVFVFAHEVCHIAFDHILRSEGKDPKIWNIATDAVINQFLKRDGLKMVKGGVDIAEAINYDAEQMYEKLLQEQKQNSEQNGGSGQDSNNQQQSQSQQQGGSGSSSSQEQNNQSQEQGGVKSGEDTQEEENQQDVGHDTHSMWADAIKKAKEQKEKSQNDKKEKTELEKKQEELEKMGEKDAFNKNKEIRKQKLEELKKEIAKQVAQAGNSTNEDVRTINDIGIARPIVDWRYILRETLNYDVDWSYRNATIEDGVVVAKLEEQPMPETEIVLDTSGSINEVLLKNFLRECKNILKHSKLKVGCFDTKFYGFNDIRTEEDIENMKFYGGGGTNFNVAVSAFSRRVENKIIFTDGAAPMPKMSIDAIWIVFSCIRINPNGGKVIYITPEQLDRLYSYEIESETKGRTR